MKRKPNGQPGPNVINLKLEDSQPVTCQQCGHDLFQKLTMLRKFSPIQTGRQDGNIIEIAVAACAACGHVDPACLPEGITREPVDAAAETVAAPNQQEGQN
jgi:predicted Zn-ribbon and HTH transcriptional regulator